MGNKDKKNKKNKKKKDKEKVVVEVKVDEPSVPVEPEPKKEIEIPDDIKEFWGEGETDNRKYMVSFFNSLVKRGYTVEADWEHNYRTGIYEYVYKIKKAV